MKEAKKSILIIKHVEVEGPGLIADFLKEKALPYRVVELSKNELLPDVDNCRGIISLGGPMNVYQDDEYPFLKEEEDFFKKALKRQIPILGICLGAQLLARVLGARVTKARRKEVGWQMVRLTSEGREDSLFKGLAKDLLVFQWHEDMFTVPEGGRLLAFSDVCPQAFRYAEKAYGIQFHFETTAEMIKEWMNGGSDVFLDSDDFSEKCKILAQEAEIILENYCRLI